MGDWPLLENLVNDSEVEAIAAIAGTSAARLSELAAIDIDSLTEEQKKRIMMRQAMSIKQFLIMKVNQDNIKKVLHKV